MSITNDAKIAKNVKVLAYVSITNVSIGVYCAMVLAYANIGYAIHAKSAMEHRFVNIA